MKHEGAKKERGIRKNFHRSFEKKERYVKMQYHQEYAKEQPRIEVHSVKYQKNQIGMVLALTEFEDDLPRAAHAYVFSDKQDLPRCVYKEYLIYNESEVVRCFKVIIDHGSLEEHKRTFTAPIKLHIEGCGKQFKGQLLVDFGKDILGW